MLLCSNITISAINKKHIVRGFSYRFRENSIYVIMGPNGSGKSTLAGAIMGLPQYKLSSGSRITLDGVRVDTLSSDKRAKSGIFLAYQNPPTLSGISLYQLMRQCTSGEQDPLAVRKRINTESKKLGIAPELLKRSLNEDFSGGERKKMELLQAIVLKPRVVLFDEIDTGVDIDALKTITRTIKSMRAKDRTIILITHYTRVLDLLSPDRVLILLNGECVSEGGEELAKKIETEGYEKATQ